MSCGPFVHLVRKSIRPAGAGAVWKRYAQGVMIAVDSAPQPEYRSVPALHAFVQSLAIEPHCYRERVSEAATALVREAEAAGCKPSRSPFTIIKGEGQKSGMIPVDVCVPLAGTRFSKICGTVRFEAYTFAYYRIGEGAGFKAIVRAATALRCAIFDADGIIAGDLVECRGELGYPVVRDFPVG